MRTILSVALSGIALVSGSSVEAPSESPEIGGTVEHIAIAIDDGSTQPPTVEEETNSVPTIPPALEAFDAVDTDTVSPSEFNSTSTTIQPEATGVFSEMPNVEPVVSTEAVDLAPVEADEDAELPLTQGDGEERGLETTTENLRLDTPAVDDEQASSDEGDETGEDDEATDGGANGEVTHLEEVNEDPSDDVTAFPYQDEESTTTAAPEFEQTTGDETAEDDEATDGGANGEVTHVEEVNEDPSDDVTAFPYQDEESFTTAAPEFEQTTDMII